MARVNVFLADELLRAIDAAAKACGSNRSALVQTALTRYLEERRRAQEEAEAQRRMDRACQIMDALAEKLGDWDPVPIIREHRAARSVRAPSPVRRRAGVRGR